jgi:DNA-binding response OmpR family regulator
MSSYILLVDDNLDLSDNLKLILEMEGYRVQAVPGVRPAIEAMQRELPRLIIADVVMPGANGYDLFQEVKANATWATIPFIFLSAMTTPEDVHRGLQLGADDYVTKPFAIVDLLATIRRHLA